VNAKGRLACCGAVALTSLGSARPADAHPQLTTGLTIGAAAKGDRSQVWTATKFSLGVRGQLLFGRDKVGPLGLGPYAEALTTSGFSDVQVGGGGTVLLPIHADLPLVVSAGAYMSHRDFWGWEPGLATELFWGSQGYNYHSFYAMSVGIFAGGRYALGASRDVTILAGLRIDLELIALPVLLLWGAIKGGNPAR
jgi:hypothetical protein